MHRARRRRKLVRHRKPRDPPPLRNLRSNAESRIPHHRIAATVTEPKVAAPPPAVQSPQQRAKAEQPGKGSQPAQPVATLPPPQSGTQIQAAPAPQVAPPAPPAQSPEQRAKAEQPGKGSQRPQPAAVPPPPQPKVAVAPNVAPPPLRAQQPTQTVPAVQPPQPQPASSEGPREKRPAPPASKSGDKKQDSDEQKPNAEDRPRKG